MKLISIQPSFKNCVVLFLGLLAASYLVLCIAAGTNSFRTINPGKDIDYRVQGLSQNGWTTEKFSFEEEKLYSLGASVQFQFEPVRPKEEGPAFISLKSGNNTVTHLQIKKDPVVAPAPENRLSTLSVQVTCDNPFKSGGESGRMLCTKLSSVSIIPRHFILFPEIGSVWALILFFSFTTLCVSSFLSLREKTLNLLPAPLLLALLFGLHQNAIFDHWPRDMWLWCFFALVSLGAILCKRYFAEFVSTACTGSRKITIMLIVTILFGLWLRISAVHFGLPQLYHPDESRKIGIARRIVETGNWDPNYFRHPSFMVYSTAALGTIKAAITGATPSVSELAVLGRSVSSVLGTATILIVFLIGSILFTPGAGLIAAMLLSVAPLHVVCSRYIKEDVCMIFFSLSSLLCILYYCYRAPKKQYYLLAGLLAGFATSVKYTGILTGSFLAVPLVLSVIALLQEKFPAILPALQRDIKKLPVLSVGIKNLLPLLIISGLLLATGFLLITPYSILNNTKFMIDFLAEKEHMNRGHTGAISAATFYWTYHFHFSILPALTHPVSILSIIGLGFVFATQSVSSYALLAGVLLFYLPSEFVNAKPFPQPERYILPCIPFLCLALGAAASMVRERLSALTGKNICPIALGLILSACPLWYSTHHRDAMLHDTRQEATDWILAHIPQGTTIVNDWYFYSPSFSSGNYKVLQMKLPDYTQILKDLSIKTLQEQNARYFIVSSFFYQRYLAQIKRGDKTALGFKEIFSKLRPVKIFSKKSYSYGFHNPTIRIYEVPQKP